MFLSIRTTHRPATDLGFLLAKHPGRAQTRDLSFGKAHVFYPEADEEACTATLLLEVNAVALSRGDRNNFSGVFELEQYVNDRPYVASSFLSTAIAKVYGSALNGNCKDRPELVDKAIPLEVEVAAVPCRAGEGLIREFFEPLGYEVHIEGMPLDEQFPEWGRSGYFRLRLRHALPLRLLLSHLFLLLPALDNKKHYYVGDEEIDKLIAKGGDWLKGHPALDLITRRYLKHKKDYVRQALDHLLGEDGTAIEEENETHREEQLEEKLSLHQLRHQAVLDRLVESGAQTVIDLGCGSGKLLRLLIREPQFDRIVGMDISYRSLEIAKKRLNFDEMSPKKRERIQLIHGALTYCDSRLQDFEAAVLVEVIEHLDPPRLEAFEKSVFRHARPKIVLITTPNREYNVLFEGLPPGQLRHSDHRFEWTRQEFQDWALSVGERFGYRAEFFPIGLEDERYGAPSQMAVFSLEV